MNAIRLACLILFVTLLLGTSVFAVSFDCNGGSAFNVGARGVSGIYCNRGVNMPRGYYTSWCWLTGIYDWTDVSKYIVGWPAANPNTNPTVLDTLKQLRDHGCSTRGVWKVNHVGDGHFNQTNGVTCGYTYCTGLGAVPRPCTMDAGTDVVTCTIWSSCNMNAAVDKVMVVSACTLDATTDLVTCANHSLLANDVIQFSGTGGGVAANTDYYVLSTSLAADKFKFSTAQNGPAFNISATANNNLSTRHGLAANDKIRFSGTVGGVAVGTDYYVVAPVAATTFKISTAQGGPVRDITASGINSLTTRHGLAVGNAVYFAKALGGVAIGVPYYVKTIPNANSFTFSTASGGPTFNIPSNANNEVTTPLHTHRGFHYTPLDITSKTDNTTSFSANTDLLAKRAGNLVWYANSMVPTYRSNAADGTYPYAWNGSAWVATTLPVTGTTYHDSSSAIANSIAWGKTNGVIDYRKLFLTTAEAPNPLPTLYTPKLAYCEMGNEAELSCIYGAVYNMAVTPADYKTRYDTMRNYMIHACDPDPNVVQTGPSLCNPVGSLSLSYLTALHGGTPSVLNFVGYHPYDVLGAYWTNIPLMEDTLNDIKSDLDDAKNVSAGYSTQMVVGEFDPTGWTYTANGEHDSMAHALGVAESIFTFAEEARASLPQKLISANYWNSVVSQAQGRIYEKMMTNGADYYSGCLGDYLIGSHIGTTEEGAYKTRVYVTKWASGSNKDIYVWGLNFNNYEEFGEVAFIDLDFTNMPAASSYTVTSYFLGNHNAGYTQLTDHNLSDLYWYGPEVVTGYVYNPTAHTMSSAIAIWPAEIWLHVYHPNP